MLHCDTTLVISALIALHLFACVLSGVVEWTRSRWPASRRYTFAWVIVGVLATIAASSIVIGCEAAIWVIVFFTASGAPMAAAAMVAHTLQDERDARQRELE